VSDLNRAIEVTRLNLWLHLMAVAWTVSYHDTSPVDGIFGEYSASALRLKIHHSFKTRDISGYFGLSSEEEMSGPFVDREEPRSCG
jgi:hypothetical protein